MESLSGRGQRVACPFHSRQLHGMIPEVYARVYCTSCRWNNEKGNVDGSAGHRLPLQRYRHSDVAHSQVSRLQKLIIRAESEGAKEVSTSTQEPPNPQVDFHRLACKFLHVMLFVRPARISTIHHSRLHMVNLIYYIVSYELSMS